MCSFMMLHMSYHYYAHQGFMQNKSHKLIDCSITLCKEEGQQWIKGNHHGTVQAKDNDTLY